MGTALTIPTDLSLIRDGMHAVTTDADGTVSFVFRGYPVTTAGKSGTAETSAPGKVDAWFIGWASFEQPSIAIEVGLDDHPRVLAQNRRMHTALTSVGMRRRLRLTAPSFCSRRYSNRRSR